MKQDDMEDTDLAEVLLGPLKLDLSKQPSNTSFIPFYITNLVKQLFSMNQPILKM